MYGCERMTRGYYRFSVFLAAIGLFTCGNPARPADLSQDATCSLSEANDIQYLNFWPPLPGGGKPHVSGIKDLVAKLGTAGDGKTRHLAAGAGIPIFVTESKIAQEIKLRLDIARQTNVAVHFNVDDHIGWDDRPDLWNWYDPTKS